MMLPYAEVIGDPIAHSKSPIIHKFWLQQLGIVADYRTVHVAPSDLSEYFESRKKDANWRGCNITVPHKIAALSHVEDRGNVADSIGAINCALKLPDGAIIGTNTDAGGFYAPIADMELAGKHVVVIGAGGAARAILFALTKCDVGFVTILNRSVEKARKLLEHFQLRGEAVALGSPVPPAALIVNSSSLGMAGSQPLDIDLSGQIADCLVYDIVYAPLKTDLLLAAEARGLETIDGLSMLIGQAAVAFELFFGIEPPRSSDEKLRALLLA